jgi:hypothetical protein
VKDQEHTAAAEDRKKEKRGGEQLRFAFFTEETDASTDVDRPASPDDISNSATDLLPQTSDLARTVTAVRAALLDVPLREVDAQLPLLLEFCEATLTRALDVAQKRPQRAFSDEEYRSLRGIGQAHWLLVERQSREK